MDKVVDARCIPTRTTTWLTPRWILDALGEFDLDPCCPPEMPWRTARNMIYYPKQDGLPACWTGQRVWLNPPYGRDMGLWMKKMAYHCNGTALVFARTDTKWFHHYVVGHALSILFLNRRVRFCRPDGTPGGSPAAPSMLLAYGARDYDILYDLAYNHGWGAHVCL